MYIIKKCIFLEIKNSQQNRCSKTKFSKINY